MTRNNFESLFDKELHEDMKALKGATDKFTMLVLFSD